MPRIDVVFYQEDGRDVPVLDWLKELRRTDQRALYFFHGRNLAILGHALTKEEIVPKADIERAIRRKKAFEENPAQHSYSEEE